ncbi:serine hydrolase [Streptomyces sp. DH12]|uniref:serine hydrolase domain-containing protein n=1 Tax=Streptomyces sp. DH12 TaxID=2857010 RepID=UPI001E40FA5C|nr:serine hydrolase domain-containing protein [Streptomyces sp. DH12]
MAKLRTRLLVPLVLAICGLSVGDPVGGPSPVLAALVTAGGAPAAGLLAQTAGTTRFETTGPSIGEADHFRAGSVTKTFVATVVLQLAAEGRLSLDAPPATYAPGLLPAPPDRRITLRHLLTHTSGLPDLAPPIRPATPSAAVRAALARRPARAPGAFSYANTEYVVLGEVIAGATGRSHAAEAHRRVIAPLRLTGTSFPGARTSLPEPHGRGHDSAGRDVTSLDPRTAGAAGELVSTLADLNRFHAALLGGRLLPRPSLRVLLDTAPADGRYGAVPTRLPCGMTVWGHDGRVPGSYVRTAATGDGRHVVTFQVSADTPAPRAPSPRAAGRALVRSVLTAEFCAAADTRPAPDLTGDP